MSSPAPSGGGNGKDTEKRRSLGKYVKRMSSVFKRDKPSKTAAAAAAAAAAASTSTSTPATPTIAEASASASTPAPKPEEKPAAPPPAAVESAPTTQQLNRSALQQERARALFAKYGLTLESHEWIASAAQTTDVQRIEKPIRMRVRRECHHCGTTYGTEKVCVKCEHKRCKKCPRFPKKKAPADTEKEDDMLEKPRKKKVLTVHSKTGGELVYRQTTQRVRRRCHKCETYFVPATASICENCRHIRCTRCPRDPVNVKKYPTGYPGDVDPEEELDLQAELQRLRTWRKPRVRVRWECEECKASFIEGNPNCPGCGHQRCEKCARRPLKRSRKEPQLNPDVVRAVEAKLHALAVDSSDPGNSGAEAT